YTAINEALSDVQTKSRLDVPDHLKDAHYKGAEALGHGVDYVYPHNYENDWYPQQYLPDKLVDTKYFQPKGNSKYEQQLKDVNEKLKRRQRDGQ
ncbi:MAG: recombinase RarA, partial [Lactobacillaceae bacterium]|nr:recombinase RarA [Lactobacillaceae bacterium]